MAEATANPIMGTTDPVEPSETQTITKVQSEDRSFITKCLHPPSAVPNFEGLPTNDSRSQVVVQWASNKLMDRPYVAAALNEEPIPVEQTLVSGFAFLTTTGMNFPVMVFTKVDGGWRQDVNNTASNDVYDVTNIWKDANLYRPIYSSITTYPNVTAFNNLGIVTAAQFNPPIEFTGTVPAFVDARPSKAHKFIKALLDSGGRFSAKHDWDYDFIRRYSKYFEDFEESELIKEMAGFTLVSKPKQKEKPQNHFTITPDMEFQIINFAAQVNNISGNSDGAVVPTSSQLINMSTRSFACQAREGNFMVNRLNTTQPKWYATSHNKQTFSPYGLYECWYSFTDALGNDNYQRFVYKAPDGRTRTCYDTFWSDEMTWGWTVYDGMVPNTNIAQGISNDQLIQLKMYRGYEIQPAAKSPWAGMQKLAPLPNIEAMQDYERAFWELKDATVAANNFLAAAAKIGGRIISNVARKAITGAIQAPFKTGRSRRDVPRKRNKSKTRQAPQQQQQAPTRYNSQQLYFQPTRRNRSRARSNSRGRAESLPRQRTMVFRRSRSVGKQINQIDSVQKEINKAKQEVARLKLELQKKLD